MSVLAWTSLHELVRRGVLWRHGVIPDLHVRQLERFEGLFAGDRARAISDHLRHLVFRAYHTVPFYKQRFDAAGVSPRDLRSSSDLAMFPVLDKAALRQHAELMQSHGRARLGARWDSTGGSTGSPVTFLRSLGARARGEANERRTWRWYGVDAGSRVALLWGADRDVPPGQAVTSWKSRLLGTCALNAFHVTPAGCREFAAILERFQPAIIYGYATALAMFAAYIRDRGVALRIAPIAIRSTAEVLLRDQRGLIEAQLHGPVFDYYGSRDAGPIAGECSVHDGLHVFEDVSHVEVIGSDGTPCEPGVVGEVVVTKLHEHAMPMIRYRTGDLAAWRDGPCECGVPFRRLSALEGRVGDFVRTPAGAQIHGEFFTHLFYGLPGVSRFQVRQAGPAMLAILVEANGRVAATDLERIRALSAARFTGQVTIEVVDFIQPGPSGKHRFVLPLAD